MVTKWTILTYIASHNNLEELGQESLQQIAAVGSSPEVIHGVLVDSSMGADRILVGKPGKLKQAEHLAQFDSGDPDRLIETAAWLFRQHPAERYGLILWSHGTGWRPEEIERIGIESHGAGHMTAGAAKRVAGLSNPVLFRSTIAKMLASTKPSERAVLFDDGTGHSLDTVELERVATRIGEMLGQPCATTSPPRSWCRVIAGRMASSSAIWQNIRTGRAPTWAGPLSAITPTSIAPTPRAPAM